MKKLYTYALRYSWILIGIIACSFPTACQQSDESGRDTDNDEYETYHINLFASVAGGFSTTTRVEEPDNSYLEPGSTAENAINPSDYKILLFDGDGNYFMEFSNWGVETSNDKVHITGQFETTVSNMPKELQLMFLANFGASGLVAGYKSYPTSMSLDDILSQYENNSTAGFCRAGYMGGSNNTAEVDTWYCDVSNNYYIPMFGLSEKFPVIGNQITIEIGLLRLFAKIEIIDERSELPKSVFPISSVRLPATRYWMRYIPDLKANPEARGINPKVNNISVTGDASNRLVRFKAVEPNKFVAYIPEMPVPHGNYDTKLYLYKDANWTTQLIVLNLQDYTDRILRNHIYRFVISDPKPEPDPEPDPGVSFWVYPWIKASSTNITFD